MVCNQEMKRAYLNIQDFYGKSEWIYDFYINLAEKLEKYKKNVKIFNFFMKNCWQIFLYVVYLQCNHKN